MVVIETSVFLARFWGFLIAGLCLLMLLRKDSIKFLFDSVKDKTFMVLSGYLAFILGLVTVLMHNLWVSDWRVIVTVFGWISLLKGISRIGWPNMPEKTLKSLKNKKSLTTVLLLVAVALGAYLVWVTY